MTSPLGPLLGTNVRAWLSSKGIWLVAFAALLPLVLTGTWVGTHRGDLTAQSIDVPDGIQEGDNVTLRAVVANTGPTRANDVPVALEVSGFGFQGLVTEHSNQTTVTLDPGQSQEITLQWTAQGGARVAVLRVNQDPTGGEAFGEVDDKDNLLGAALSVPYRPGGTAAAPAPLASVYGDANATETADVAIAALARPAFTPGQAAVLETVVENRGAAAADVTVHVRIHQVFQGATFASTSQDEPVTLRPGERRTVALTWTAAEGPWWHEAWVAPPNGTREATPEDNHRAEPFAVDVQAEVQLPEPVERQTIKEFYGVVLGLQFQVLIPLIALFYAGGVIVDERERGALPYVLTRPFPRWLIPVTKFAASFLVAALALAVGVVATYLLLFQTTPEGGDPGFLVTPLAVSLLALFAYGALFTFIGVLYARPYLVGIVWIILWEAAVYFLVPLVTNFTVQAHVRNALDAWPMDQGALWLPTGEGGVRAVLLLLAIGVGLLAAASAAMKNREFEG